MIYGLLGFKGAYFSYNFAFRFLAQDSLLVTIDYFVFLFTAIFYFAYQGSFGMIVYGEKWMVFTGFGHIGI